MLRYLAIVFVLISHATAEPPTPVPVTHAVFVHGLWQDEHCCFGALRHEMEFLGVKCLAPSLLPADARNGIVPLAEQLKLTIDTEFGPQQRFVMISFSLGGLVGRSYLQDMGGADRCDAFVTISTPHHGTRMAAFHHGAGAAQMRVGSAFLRLLQQTESALDGIPVISYRTPFDMIIVPSRNSIWQRAENVSVAVASHPMMTASPKVRGDLLRRFSYPAYQPPAAAR